MIDLKMILEDDWYFYRIKLLKESLTVEEYRETLKSAVEDYCRLEVSPTTLSGKIISHCLTVANWQEIAETDWTDWADLRNWGEGNRFEDG